MTAIDVFTRHRPELFAVAYRLLGTVSEAEDVLQEAYLRLQDVDLAAIERPAAWLTTVVSRLCLTHLTSARRRRERYVGPWLPEPLLTSPDVADDVVMAESVSAAFLVLLEMLSPEERVAFVLHDVFGHPFRDIATVLDRREDACRKLASRARAAVATRRPRFAPRPDLREQAAAAFLSACRTGDTTALVRLLAPDAVCRTDGGGVVSAGRRPIHGADRVARLLRGILPRDPLGLVALPDVNGGPGFATVVDGALTGVAAVCVDVDGHVAAVDLVRNPHKLSHLTGDPRLSTGAGPPPPDRHRSAGTSKPSSPAP